MNTKWISRTVSLALAAGCIVLLAGAPVRAADTIKIGFFGPLTGPFAGLGIDAKKGADLAVNEINGSGGIKGKKVELVSYDDRGNRAEAVSVARKMI